MGRQPKFFIGEVAKIVENSNPYYIPDLDVIVAYKVYENRIDYYFKSGRVRDERGIKKFKHKED